MRDSRNPIENDCEDCEHNQEPCPLCNGTGYYKFLRGSTMPPISCVCHGTGYLPCADAWWMYLMRTNYESVVRNSICEERKN